jgi:chorismate dehydratase
MVNRKDAVSPLTLGWIPYWNLRPLRIELQRLWGDSLKLIKGHPSEINRLMESGEISCAPSSSINLLLNPNLEIALPAGVAATGEVLSVYLTLPAEFAHFQAAFHSRTAELRAIFQSGLEQFPEENRKAAKYIWQRCDQLRPLMSEPPRLTLSGASASGAMLSRILYRMYFGLDAYNLQAAEDIHHGAGMSSQGAMRLVIGDQALIERPNYSKVLDLGAWWFELTGLPFVFAVWQQSKGSAATPLRSKLMECVNRAQAKMKVEPTEYLPSPLPLDVTGRAVDLANYWKCINYRLGMHEMQSMLVFFALSRSFLNAELAQTSAVRIVRWREQVGCTSWLS